MVKKWVKEVRDGWGLLPPKWRMAIRTIAIAGITYLYTSQADGSFNMNSFFDAVKIAGTYAIVGLFTPLEPFVGIGKPAVVGVPSPPAVDSTPPPAPPTTLAPKQ